MATGQASPKIGKVVDIPDTTVTIGTAVDGGTGSTASVPFTSTLFTTGGPQQKYIATSTPDSFTGTATTSPIIVSGLTAGTTYTFKVAGGNATGYAVNSNASNSVIIIAQETWAQAFSVATGTISSANTFTGVADSSGNLYVWFVTSTAGELIVAKISANGSITWNNKMTFSSVTGIYSTGGICLDASGNIVIATGAPGAGILIVKINSSGTVQWAKGYGSTSVGDCNDVIADSSSNLYAIVSTAGANYDACLVKFDSSGAIQWQVKLTSSAYDFFYGMAIDSSANVTCVGMSFIGTNASIIARYNSSGTLQWQRQLYGNGSGYQRFFDACTDSSGNIYAVININTTGGTNWCIVKYNSSGTIQWQKQINNTGISIPYSINIDSSGTYLYSTGGVTVSGTNIKTIIKLDLNGTVQWQRSLNDSTYTVTYGKPYIQNGFIKLPTSYVGDGKIWNFSLPDDGSHTGTITAGGATFTYAIPTHTVATSTFTDATQNWTTGTLALSNTTPTVTTTSTSYTQTFTTF
jgi:hypothetical protein